MEHRDNRLKDITGKRFGALTVIEFAGRHVTPCGSIQTLYKCKCDCGNLTTAKRVHLVNGHTKSCGCLSRFVSSLVNLKHGMRQSAEYRIWSAMRNRCNNKNGTDYSNYGGRGISVCERWNSFENFFSDMGNRPEGMSIDRIDVDGNYEPENCRWATNHEQAVNRRNAVIVEYKGKMMPLSEVASKFNMNYSTLYSRIFRAHLTLEEALK